MGLGYKFRSLGLGLGAWGLMFKDLNSKLRAQGLSFLL